MSQKDELKQITRLGVYGATVRDNKILLITKGCAGVYANLLDLPGGGVEFGESPEETLAREFQEEVGMTFESSALITNLSHTRTAATHELHGLISFHHLGQIYAVLGVKEAPDVTAQDQFQWYPLASLTEERLTPFAWDIVSKLKARSELLAGKSASFSIL